ncbi:MAG: Fe-S cluster assembly sulfur transfer protein SufU [Myxococcales bacterium]|nr:SUF system NifU family Fe-S cluster assembly protein [Myxococcales bacterium]
MTDLYQQTIVEHAKRPRNFGPLPGANRGAQGVNPLCGDEIELHLRVEGDRVEAATFEGAGCAVCVASASMMTLAVKGSSAADAARLMQRVRDLVAGGDGKNLGEIESLKGVARYPARRKCALLAWRALEAALAGEATQVSTEL